MRVTISRDKYAKAVIRVEAIDGDGECQVAAFSGPLAKERAADFCVIYYSGEDVELDDPDGLLV